MLDSDMLRCLVCPITGCRLKVSTDKRWLISEGAGLRFPLRDGVPVLKVEYAKRWSKDDDIFSNDLR